MPTGASFFEQADLLGAANSAATSATASATAAASSAAGAATSASSAAASATTASNAAATSATAVNTAVPAGAGTLLGLTGSAGHGVPITLGANLSLSGTTLNATGSGGGSGTAYSADGTTITLGGTTFSLGTVPLNNIAAGGATNGQALVYNSGTGHWAPGTVSGSGATPGGTSGQIQTNNGAGGFNGVTIVPVANGGTGTASPGIVAGTNVTVTGTWPNQTITSSGGTAAAGGTNGQLQVNNSGAMGGLTIGGGLGTFGGSLFVSAINNASANGQLAHYATNGSNQLSPLTLGTNLSITGTTLNAAGGGGTVGLTPGGPITGSELLGGAQSGSNVSFTIPQIATALAAIQVAPSGQPTSVRIYQRDTRTGGTFSKGAGAVTFSVTTLAGATTLEYRLRDAAATSTTLVDWTQFATNVIAGTAVFSPSMPASNKRYLLDIRANGYTSGASSGTQPFGVGEIVAGAGQSLLVNGFTTTLQAGNVDSGTTLASLGLTPNATSPVFASAAGQGNTVSNSSPTWAIPADSTFYGSSFAAQLLKDLSAALGVPCALIGHARGGFVIAGFQSGTPDGTQLRSVITAAGGKFGLFIWFQGHSDNATNGSGTPAPNSGYLSLANTLSGSALASGYQAALGTLISGLASTSSISFKTIICTIPALIATSGNSASGVFQVRSGAKAYAAASGGNAVVVDAVDATLYSDGTHWSQTGNVIGAHHMARAALGLLGLGDGDTGPTITSAIRGTVASGNQAKITLTVTNSSTASYPTPGLTTVGTATTQFQVFDSGTVTSPYTVSAVTIVDATHIQLTITSPPGDAGALDLYVRYPFDASSTVVSSGVYDTNTADGIGSTGRQLVIPAASVTVAAPNAVAPGNVTSLAAGTPTSSTIPVTYTAPSTGTTPFTYSGQTSPDNSTWTNNGGAFTGTGGTFTGLSASTAYYLRVVVSNGVNPNSTTNVPTNPVTTAASSPYPTISSATTVAHYDASLLSGAGTSIATLTDVANGNNLTGAGGSQPTVSTAGAQQINSKNVIVFTGSQKLTGGGGASSLGGNMSGIAVFKGTFNQGIIASLGASSNGGFGDQFWLQLGSTPSINITRAGTGGGQLSVAGGSSATLYKIIWRYTASTGLVEAWINGVYSSATHGTSAGSTWNQMVLGQINSTAGGFFYTGSIAEVWTFSGTLSGVANSASSGDVATLQSYMTSTWG